MKLTLQLPCTGDLAGYLDDKICYISLSEIQFVQVQCVYILASQLPVTVWFGKIMEPFNDSMKKTFAKQQAIVETQTNCPLEQILSGMFLQLQPLSSLPVARPVQLSYFLWFADFMFPVSSKQTVSSHKQTVCQLCLALKWSPQSSQELRIHQFGQLNNFIPSYPNICHRIVFTLRLC